MAVSIYFAETRDFKLIRERILAEENDYLVYVYADTKNIKIPRDLIKELPLFGNNIVWVDSAAMDFSQIANHIALTIGQFLNAEDPINFIIASRTSKYDKVISLLKAQEITVEQIGISAEKPAKKSTGRRGRPKGSTKKQTKVTDTINVAPKKKRGRPKKVKQEEPVIAPKKKRGRPAKAKTTVDVVTPPKKRGRPRKEVKPVKKARKSREDKAISAEMVKARLAQFPSKDKNVVTIQNIIFALRKVQRPKFDQKLSKMIQTELSVNESEADAIIKKMKNTGMVDNSGKENRLMYKD